MVVVGIVENQGGWVLGEGIGARKPGEWSWGWGRQWQSTTVVNTDIVKTTHSRDLHC